MTPPLGVSQKTSTRESNDSAGRSGRSKSGGGGRIGIGMSTSTSSSQHTEFVGSQKQESELGGCSVVAFPSGQNDVGDSASMMDDVVMDETGDTSSLQTVDVTVLLGSWDCSQNSDSNMKHSKWDCAKEFSALNSQPAHVSSTGWKSS